MHWNHGQNANFTNRLSNWKLGFVLMGNNTFIVYKFSSEGSVLESSWHYLSYMHWNFVIITKNYSNNWISRSLPKFEKFIWTWLKFWTPTLLKPTYLSLPWSEFKYFSAHHIENFLNFLELTQLLSLCQFWRSLWAFKQNRPCYLSYFVCISLCVL